MCAAPEGCRDFFTHSDPQMRIISGRISQGRVPRLFIKTLGVFRVSRDEIPMEEADWDRNQPKKLLKAIVSRGSTCVPRAVLVDDLWPGEEFETAGKRFKTLLQRLRRSLEPGFSREFGSSYVHLHDHSVSLDLRLCEVDVDVFLSFLKDGEEKERKGDTLGSLSSYMQAVEMYQGDFLPEEPFEQWADIKREEVRNVYMKTLMRMAQIYEKRGAFKKALSCYEKITRTDVLREDGYRGLMAVYSRMGMPNEARLVYQSCKKALARELNSDPDPITTAIYRKIEEQRNQGWL